MRSDGSNEGEHTASFLFPVPISVPTNADAYIKLLKLTFPHSYYLIDAYHDKLIISDVTYTLSHGNYNAATMLVYLRTLLPITIDYSPSRYRFTFSHGSAFQIGSASTVLTALGFKAHQCDTDHTSVEAAGAAKLHGHHSIKITCPNFNLLSYDSSVRDNHDNHLLAHIPVSQDTHEASSFIYESYSPSTPYLSKVQDHHDISEIKIHLFDHENVPIAFNSVPWSIKLAVFVVDGNKNLPMYANNASSPGPPDASATEEARTPSRILPAPEARLSPPARPRRRQRRKAPQTPRRKQPTRKK
jgi:hypothetical protein